MRERVMEVDIKMGADPFLPEVVEKFLQKLMSTVQNMDDENESTEKSRNYLAQRFKSLRAPDLNIKKGRLLKILTQKLNNLFDYVHGTNNSLKLISESLNSLLKKILSISLEIDDFLEQLPLWSTQSKKKKNDTLLCITSFNSRLDEVCTDFFSSFKSPSTEATTNNEHSQKLFPKSYPFVDQDPIVGRDDDTRNVMEMILLGSSGTSPSSSSGYADQVLPVIAIVGMVGIGKTVLAQLIYENATMVNHFSERFWVCANDGNFGVDMLVNEMLLSLTGMGRKAKLDIEAQKLKIREMLNEKRFLLVLDDVWDVRYDYWDHIRGFFRSIGGFTGSVILITTQSDQALVIMRPSISYHLHQLTEDDSWELFKKRTFARIGKKVTPELEANLRVLVKKIGGLPLGIKVMADQLLTRWSVDQSELLHLFEQTKEQRIFPYLRLSFDRLPSTYIKMCFAFCATNPKGSRIYKDELIQKWTAQGYLVPALYPTNLTMEEIGEVYFEFLLQSFFVQSVERDQYGEIVSFSMHDLVHDLAIYISNRCDLNCDSSKTTSCYGVRHLSFFPYEGRNL